MNFNRIFSKNGLDELFIKLYLIVVCGGCLSKCISLPMALLGSKQVYYSENAEHTGPLVNWPV